MSLMPAPRTSSCIGDSRGFTLIETLVAVFAGVIVMSATFSILDVSLRQSSRIADRVSADQRARLAMEKIVLELHSSCVSPNVTPIEEKSEDNKLFVVSQTGAESAFAKVKLHEISLKAGKLVDASYLNTSATAPNWEFSKIASQTQTLLSNVSQSTVSKSEKTIPIFQYYKYEGSELVKIPEKTILTKEEADTVAAVAVSFATGSESGNNKGDRMVDLTDTVVLRFSPASTLAINTPCA